MLIFLSIFILSIFNFLGFAQAQLRKTGQITSLSTSQSAVFALCLLSSIDSCQNRVSADQSHLAVSRAQVSTHRGWVFFEVIRWQFTRFQMIAGSRLRFSQNSYQICCVYVSIAAHRPALLRFWFQTDIRRTIQPVCLKYRRGRPFLTMVTC